MDWQTVFTLRKEINENYSRIQKLQEEITGIKTALQFITKFSMSNAKTEVIEKEDVTIKIKVE